MRGSADVGRYADSSSEDYEDYRLSANGRIDIRRDRYVYGALSFSELHEDRSSPDDANGVSPAEYREFLTTVGIFNKWNRLSLRLQAQGLFSDFDDVTTSGGATINHDDRDRTRYLGTARVGYEIVPEYEAFLRGAWRLTDYDDATDDDGLNRDFDYFRITAGARIDFTGILFGDLFAGYQNQAYDDSRFQSIGGPTFGGKLTWNLSKLTTIGGSVERRIQETTLTESAGYFGTEFSASVNHELLRNLIIGGDARLIFNDYEGIGRDDDEVRAGIYIRYLMNRNIYFSTRYDYQTRDSNVSGADYNKNVIMFRLETQL